MVSIVRNIEMSSGLNMFHQEKEKKRKTKGYLAQMKLLFYFSLKL